jgi:hypothetical protein
VLSFGREASSIDLNDAAKLTFVGYTSNINKKTTPFYKTSRNDKQ